MGQAEDIPLPLFASKKMIDRDAARINAGKTSTMRPSYHSTHFEQLPVTPDVEKFWRFKNTCQRIDTEPRTADHPPGIFTDAELAMFDPVFRNFITDCYKHGIPGHKQIPTRTKDVLESPYGRHDGDDGPPPGCMRPSPPKEEQLSTTLTAVHESSGPYWDFDTWKAWAEDVAVKAKASPATSHATGGDYFKGFTGVRPSRLQSTHSASTLISSSSIISADWWLSDEWLLDAGVAVGPYIPASPQLQAVARHSVVTDSSMDPDGQRFPTLRNSLIVHLDRNKTARGNYAFSTSGSSDVSVTFHPLPATLRTTMGANQAMDFVDQGTKHMISKPSKWVVKRIEKLRGAKRA
jgi:hypothetical protein